MLTLDLNNNFFVLDPAFGILVKWNNPACFTDKIVGDMAVNINLPINEINRAILGNPEMFEKYGTGADRKFTRATLSYGGAVLLSGTLVVMQALDSYDCWLQSDLGAMAEEQREKFINELNWPTDKELTSIDRFDYDDSTHEFGTMPIQNRNFWEGKGIEQPTDEEYIDTNGMIKFSDELRNVIGHQMYLNYSAWVNKSTLDINNILQGGVISPFLFLRYAIKELLRLNRFYIDRNDMISEDYINSPIRNLMLYNNFNIVNIQLVYSPLTIKYWDEDLRLYVPATVNKVTGKSFVLDAFDYKDLVPRKTVKDFLLGLQNSINYIFRFRNDLKVDIIDRNQVLNTTPIDLAEYLVGKWHIGERKNLILKFMPEYDKEDSKFDGEFEDLSGRWQDFGEPVSDMAELQAIASPQFGELRLVTNLNSIYEYKWQATTRSTPAKIDDPIDTVGWEYVSSGPQPYLYGRSLGGTEIEEIRSAFSTPQQLADGSYIVVQKGNIKSMRSLWNDFSLRLLHGNENASLESLWWEGEHGLFENRWKNWARFWRNRLEVNAEFNLPVNMIDYITRNITNKYNTHEGEFIIETMETEFKLNSVGLTRIKGYKV